MFEIKTQLFEGPGIFFGPIDPERDAEIESRWTHDSEFMRLMEIKPAHPMSPAMVRKQYETIEKDIEDSHSLYYFAIRAKADERLMGKAVLEWIEWTNGNGWIRLGLGAAQDRRKGYGTQALHMLLRFAFTELNLFRVSAMLPAYNEGMLALLTKSGFMQEVCRREAIERDGHFWDLLMFGLLRTEWQALALAAPEAQP